MYFSSSRLIDRVPTFRQGRVSSCAGETVLNGPIFLAVSNFQDFLATCDFWPAYCLFRCCLQFEQLAGGNRVMQVFHASDAGKISDGALVAAVKRGDTQAFEDLFLR